jgi:hypothetical protein
VEIARKKNIFGNNKKTVIGNIRQKNNKKKQFRKQQWHYTVFNLEIFVKKKNSI